jgi:hypothetical protein
MKTSRGDEKMSGIAMSRLLTSRLIEWAPGHLLSQPLRCKFKRYLRLAFLRRLPKHSIGAEIGVWQGDFTADILATLQPTRLHLIDPWASQPDAADHLYQIEQNQMEGVYRSVVRRFAGDDRVEFHRAFSADAAKDLADGSLDWVYIDGNHEYEAVKLDMESYLPKLRPGGLLTGDDYTWRPDLGYPVKRAVDEMCRSGRVRKLWIRRGQWILKRDS